MIVCICKGISDRRIQEEVRRGARSLRQVQQSCRAGTDCGACVRQICSMLGTRPSASRSGKGNAKTPSNGSDS